MKNLPESEHVERRYNPSEHWQGVYAGAPPEKLGWYKPHLDSPLKWIEDLNLAPDSPLIDVGAGVSTLVDDLLQKRYSAVTVLDMSVTALSRVRDRLGDGAKRVTWICSDILSAKLPPSYFRLWHDRAMFHFLTEEAQAHKYLEILRNSLRPDGYVMLSTFAPEAPPTCSGLSVHRYHLDELRDAVGPEFDLLHSQKELHVTPGGIEQMYLNCVFKRLTK